MNIIGAIAGWLADNIFGQPAILIGLIALIGLLAQRKNFSDTVLGTLKTIVGFLIMGQGAGIVVGALLNFTPILQSAFGIEQVPWGGMGLDTLFAEWGGVATLIMAFGFLINVLLARFTPLKYIYLTGHLMFWVSITMVAVFLEIDPNMAQSTMIIVGSIIMGLYWTLQPAYMQPLMRKVTGGDALAYGHTSSSGAWIGAMLARFVGKPEQSSEDVQLPQRFEFFRDVTAGTAFLIAIVTVIAALIAGAAVVQPLAGDLNYIVYAIIQGFTFAAGITVLLVGVRMLIAEIVPAFRGFATRIVPDSKPALDCPIVFDYAPTAVILGFLGATAAFLITMVVLGSVFSIVVIPPLIQLFFPGGASGVFGNRTGGWKGAILGGAVTGLLLAVGQAITIPILGTTSPELATQADPDWYILILLVKGILGPVLG